MKKVNSLEVWLQQDGAVVHCFFVDVDDEKTYDSPGVDSLSMTGAQREITGYLIDQGYQAVSGWRVEGEDSYDGEQCVRDFKLSAETGSEVTA